MAFFGYHLKSACYSTCFSYVFIPGLSDGIHASMKTEPRPWRSSRKMVMKRLQTRCARFSPGWGGRFWWENTSIQGRVLSVVYETSIFLKWKQYTKRTTKRDCWTSVTIFCMLWYFFFEKDVWHIEEHCGDRRSPPWHVGRHKRCVKACVQPLRMHGRLGYVKRLTRPRDLKWRWTPSSRILSLGWNENTIISYWNLKEMKLGLNMRNRPLCTCMGIARFWHQILLATLKFMYERTFEFPSKAMASGNGNSTTCIWLLLHIYWLLVGVGEVSPRKCCI